MSPLSNLLSRIVTPFFKSGEKYSFEECRISPSNATSLLEVLRGNQIKLTQTILFRIFFTIYRKPDIFFNNHSLPLLKVIYPKYSKHWSYTVAHTFDCVCNKMLNHGLNHGFFLSLFKLIPSPIHCIVYVLAYSNLISRF